MDKRVQEFTANNPSDKPYTYDSLERDCIRLVRILPGSQGDPVQLELETHPFSTCPEYEALSYTWGAGTHVKYISCNGLDFAVTASLEIALSRFRLPNSPRLLWVDQCCINQSDVVEISQQVNQMRNIYESAIRVLAWLGLDMDGGLAEEASRVVVKFSSIISSGKAARTVRRFHSAREPERIFTR